MEWMVMIPLTYVPWPVAMRLSFTMALLAAGLALAMAVKPRAAHDERHPI
jgi:hypothetical protein